MKKLFFLLLLFNAQYAWSQKFLHSSKASKRWVDSVFNELSLDEKIAQLFIIRAHSNLPQDHIEKVTQLIKKYNVGGLCFFQGGPVRQAKLTNYYQSIAKTPLLITIDAEWGVGMRLDSVELFPKNMMLGATQNNTLVEEVGEAIARQCKLLGIHINYAPVVDINNNSANPVINDRSFGENKILVTDLANSYIMGLESQNIMACAKHFPGHGDVSVDSHLDLPIINKSFKSVDEVELYPFKQQINKNISCIMTAHLQVPSLDSTYNTPSSLSKKTIQKFLKQKLGYKGLIITDGLEMKGVTKYYSGGEISAKAIIAGNDLLCLPELVDSSILSIKKALKNKKLTKKQLFNSVKKVLLAKYNLGLFKPQQIDFNNLVENLNKDAKTINEKVAENAITIVNEYDKEFYLDINKNETVLHVSIGNGNQNTLSQLLQKNLNTSTIFFKNSFSNNFKIRDSIEPRAIEAYKESAEKFNLVKSITDTAIYSNKYKKVIVSIHQYNRRPANNFGLDSSVLYLINQLGKIPNATIMFFGNPYAIKFATNARNIIACYEDNAIVQEKAFAVLTKKIKAVGKLPISIQ